MEVILISAKNENKQLQSVSIEAILNFEDGRQNCFTMIRLNRFESELNELVSKYFSDVKTAHYTEAELKQLEIFYKP